MQYKRLDLNVICDRTQSFLIHFKHYPRNDQPIPSFAINVVASGLFLAGNTHLIWARSTLGKAKGSSMRDDGVETMKIFSTSQHNVEMGLALAEGVVIDCG